MATSFSPQPSFHLCPDFSIAPPPDGHLELGSVLRGLDFSNIFSPLNLGDTIEIPDSQLWPLDKPSEKSGFSRSLGDLRGLEGNIWAKIFGKSGPGPKFSFERSRENDEILTVERVFVRYFMPTSAFMKATLEVDGVAFYINDTKRKKPVYIITGLMWTEGAKLSKIKSKKNSAGGQLSVTDPTSVISFGERAAYESGQNSSSSFDGSTPFILGMRVRKVWWDRAGVRHNVEDIVGATLGGSKLEDESVMNGLQFVDDEVNGATRTILDESWSREQGPITWVLPE